MKQRIETIKERIRHTAVSCGRNPQEIRLIAVTKTVTPERIRQAFDAGLDTFGENYIQEARDKIAALSAHPVSWHFIGHLQTNKAKYAVKLFDVIHTVDSEKLAMELNRQAEKIGKVQHILIQVNISGEQTKSGVAPDRLLDLLDRIHSLTHISVRGLMTIPPYFDNPEHARPFFSKLRNLRDMIRKQNIPQMVMDELSMGMTGDFEAAIEEGATMVRIGTAIFGQRS